MVWFNSSGRGQYCEINNSFWQSPGGGTWLLRKKTLWCDLTPPWEACIAWLTIVSGGCGRRMLNPPGEACIVWLSIVSGGSRRPSLEDSSGESETRDSGKGSVRGSPAVSGKARHRELGWLPEGPVRRIRHSGERPGLDDYSPRLALCCTKIKWIGMDVNVQWFHMHDYLDC